VKQKSISWLSPAILILALALSMPAFGWEGAVVQESTGTLHQEFYGDPSPTPGYCYWEKDTDGGPLFLAANTDGYGNMGCPYPWFVNCDGDSLVYRGSWPYIEADYLRSGRYEVDLSCSVMIQAETRLAASRSVAGVLDSDVHTLTLVYEDGTSLPILAAGEGPDEAQIILQPGTYSVILQVVARQSAHNKRILDPYEGSVVLKWEDPAGVAVESTSWGAIKATFR
jgi:hypothetical protein